MRSNVWRFATILVVGLALAAAAAEVPAFAPRVTDVTVFKDGHALVLARGQAKLADGWCRTHDVPTPILGTFWAFVNDNDAEVDLVKAGMAKEEETRPCLTLDEILEANAGKRVVITELPAGNPAAQPVVHEGILLNALKHETARESVATKSVGPEYDRWGRYIGSSEVKEAREEKIETTASFVMVETPVGVDMIPRANIRSAVVRDKQPATRRTASKDVREIAIHVASKGKAAEGEREVGFVYLQRGIRWIPDYRVELLDGGKAKVTLQASVVNEVADLVDADLRLVVGVPSFLMKDSLSPLALREAAPSLGSFFAPPAKGGRGSVDQSLSNAMQSQVVAAAPARPEGEGQVGPNIPAEGQKEDLFLYHRPHVTLKKGDRAVVRLLELTTPYEDIYTWDLPPLPPRELWERNGDRQRQLADLLATPRAMHKVRLTNTGTTPWTTGPASVFKGNAILGQQLMTFTSVKNSVEVPITVATDLNTKREESEVRREPNAISMHGTSFTRISMHGKLTVTNFKGRAVHLVINRSVFGTASTATADGRTRVANLMEDTTHAEDYPWASWWGWWPWWWRMVNPLSTVTWEIDVPAGKSVSVEYDWFYYHG